MIYLRGYNVEMVAYVSPGVAFVAFLGTQPPTYDFCAINDLQADRGNAEIQARIRELKRDKQPDISALLQQE